MAFPFARPAIHNHGSERSCIVSYLLRLQDKQYVWCVGFGAQPRLAVPALPLPLFL